MNDHEQQHDQARRPAAGACRGGRRPNCHERTTRPPIRANRPRSSTNPTSCTTVSAISRPGGNVRGGDVTPNAAAGRSTISPPTAARTSAAEQRRRRHPRRPVGRRSSRERRSAASACSNEAGLRRGGLAGSRRRLKARHLTPLQLTLAGRAPGSSGQPRSHSPAGSSRARRRTLRRERASRHPVPGRELRRRTAPSAPPRRPATGVCARGWAASHAASQMLSGNSTTRKRGSDISGWERHRVGQRQRQRGDHIHAIGERQHAQHADERRERQRAGRRTASGCVRRSRTGCRRAAGKYTCWR